MEQIPYFLRQSITYLINCTTWLDKTGSNVEAFCSYSDLWLGIQLQEHGTVIIDYAPLDLDLLFLDCDFVWDNLRFWISRLHLIWHIIYGGIQLSDFVRQFL